MHKVNQGLTETEALCLEDYRIDRNVIKILMTLMLFIIYGVLLKLSN